MALAPNRVLLAGGEVGGALFRISRGWAFRSCQMQSGARQILDFLLPGEIIGLQSALLGVSEHSVRSLTTLRVQAIEARLVTEAFENSPALAIRLARHVAAEASRAEELLTVIGCGDAMQRLAFLMLSLYRRQARRSAIDAGDCPFPLRRQHMADALGLTGAHINRTLNRLRADGIAAIDNQRLSIRNLQRLEEVAGAPAA